MDQLVTLGAVLLGALTSFLATSLAERARWRRERAVRWDERRMAAYEAYGSIVKRHIMLSFRIAAGGGIETGGDPLPAREGAAQLAEVELERTSTWERVLLLGDPATVAAARTWHEKAWRLEAYARGTRPADRAEFFRVFDEAAAARREFYVCARRDLGVAGDAAPVRVIGPLDDPARIEPHAPTA